MSQAPRFSVRRGVALADESAVTAGEAKIGLTVILPAVNEDGAVARIVQEVQESLRVWPQRWELLVVDDGSVDATADAAAAAGATVIRRPERGGYGATVKTGVRAAQGEWIALLDADGSYDATVLPRLLELLPTYDQVNGCRQPEQGTLALPRRAAKWAIRKLAEWISGKRIPDLNTGMKVFKRQIALDCLWALPDGFSASTSLTLAFLCDGRLVTWVPIPYRPRIGQSKFRPLRDTMQYLSTVLRVILYFRPLRVFLPLAGAVLAVALPLSIWHMLFSPLGLADADVILFCLAAMTGMFGLLAELIVAQRR